VAEGARPELPTKDSGTFISPQVLTNVTHNMSVMRDETFGPVVGIMKVSSDEEAIELMNDSEFGLTGSIWTRNIDGKAEELADQVEAGTVFINRSDYPDPALAWTGIKNSGRGCTLSKFGFDQFIRYSSRNYNL
jgi:acyl-CoA reductase-like NAD-dependent aldehyde dehydrogenase